MTTASGALAHVKRAFEYIEHIESSDRTLYSSTKRTIKEMMTICSDIIEIGSSLIGDDSSAGGSSSDKKVDNQLDASRTNTSALDARLDAIEKSISELTSLYNMSFTHPKSLDQEIIPRGIIVPNESADIPDNSFKPASLSTAEKRNKIKCINEELKQAVEDIESDMSTGAYSNGYNESGKDCATLIQLIQRWYEVRFINLDRSKSKFRYHINNIPQYVEAIVLNFTETPKNLQSKWLDKFNTWLQAVENNDSSVSSYALPSETFQWYKELKNGCNVSSKFINMLATMQHMGLQCVYKHTNGKFDKDNFTSRCSDI